MFTILTLFTLTTLITGSGTSIDRFYIKIFLKKICCADSGADSGAEGDEDSDADWSSGAGAWRARVQPDSSSSNQDTSSSNSCISSSRPLSLVICDGFPVVM